MLGLNIEPHSELPLKDLSKAIPIQPSHVGTTFLNNNFIGKKRPPLHLSY